MDKFIAALESWAQQTRGAYVYKDVKAEQVLDAFKSLLSKQESVSTDQSPTFTVECPLPGVPQHEHDMVESQRNRLIELSIQREAQIQRAINLLYNGEEEAAIDLLERIPREA
jgi:molybdopterin-biosynthesis enzyme MoeA-like protein